MTEEIIFKQSLSYAEMAVVTGGNSQLNTGGGKPPEDGEPDDLD